eukprot:SAG11_NODE_5377_length_1579_cov_2.113514_1_plen_146_part_00
MCGSPTDACNVQCPCLDIGLRAQFGATGREIPRYFARLFSCAQCAKTACFALARGGGATAFEAATAASRGKRGGSRPLTPSKTTENAQNRQNAQGSTLHRKRLFGRKRHFFESVTPNPKSAKTEKSLTPFFKYLSASDQSFKITY